MPGMDLSAVLKDLDRRFAEPLPEFYNRRIIFWYDEEREFEDRIKELQLDNVKIVVLTGSNAFAVKKLLCEDDLKSNFLVYQPFSFNRDDDNWLLNVQLYSEEFRADLTSILMTELGLPQTPIVRGQIKRYAKFFNARLRREAFSKIKGTISTKSQIALGVMAVLSHTSELSPKNVIRAVIGAGNDNDSNAVYNDFVNYGVYDAFWTMVGQLTGYKEENAPSLANLTIHLLLTAASRKLGEENLEGLERFISIPHQATCYDIVSEWLHSDERDELGRVARSVENETRLYQRLTKLDVELLADTECLPCVNECILQALMGEICDNIINVDVIKKIVEKRRALAWYDGYSDYYESVLQVANMQQFYLEHSAGFHTVDPSEVWKAYTSDYYRMDAYYRQFHLRFQRSLKVSVLNLDDLFKQVAEKVEGLYSHWFLGQLGENWSNACADDLNRHGRLFEVSQQTDFYRDKVEKVNNRVFVVISDALRFEVAASLTEKLQREPQNVVKLTSCEALFPTITKFGMAALLPHDRLTIVEKENGALSICADGIPTDAAYREKILKSANEKSVVLKYDNIIGMKRAERAALVKGMDVVYIYHNKIDEASHTSDAMVFSACEEAIAEIDALVRIIVNDFRGTRVFITADHGFLYTYSPLNEDDKLDKSDFAKSIVEYGRRYALTLQDASPTYLMPIRFMTGHADYGAYAPRENVRIKMNGGGMNFVHGGVSLQEMVVPVIDYQRLRTNSKEYQNNRDKFDMKPVELSLLATSRKIYNMIFSLNFHQTEAVGGNREAATYLLYFTDAAGNHISDTCKIIADKTDTNAQARTFRCNFNLRSQKYNNLDCYYLTIADESGLQAPKREEFQIDIAFAVDEFNFFE